MSSVGRELAAQASGEPSLPLSGTRVFVVEDEALVLMSLEDMLGELGCTVGGSATRVEAALEAARDGAFDVALLDVNVGGRRIDPVAKLIAGRDIPMVFVTGYDRPSLPAGFQDYALLQKPYALADLQAALQNALGRRAA